MLANLSTQSDCQRRVQMVSVHSQRRMLSPNSVRVNTVADLLSKFITSYLFYSFHNCTHRAAASTTTSNYLVSPTSEYPCAFIGPNNQHFGPLASKIARGAVGSEGHNMTR